MLIFAIISAVLCFIAASMREWNGFNFFLFLAFCSGLGYAFQLLR